ncbi:MAG: DUF488 domain-containing protein [Blastocatellia bacterium]|nr:DUF488 domain-containing protein [Blastocatellia bacterium]
MTAARISTDFLKPPPCRDEPDSISHGMYATLYSRFDSAIILTPMTLYTIGHSNALIGAFIGLLKNRGIETLVDTRSQPFSRYAPQFNRSALDGALAAAGVEYVFMGDLLGGRPVGPEFYLSSGKVDYDRLAEAPFYLEGIDRLLEIARSRRAAFMCSEADYKNCHRYKLITRTLVRRGIEVCHIAHSGDMTVSSVSEFEPDQLSLF